MSWFGAQAAMLILVFGPRRSLGRGRQIALGRKEIVVSK
jgi:hypothetical protein